MEQINIKLLKFGAIQTLLMAVYHFYIPFQYNWSHYLSEESPTINWSLYALNNYFSFILLIVGLFLLYHLYSNIEKIEIIKSLATVIFIFWTCSFIYLLVDPMPLPARLNWIGYVISGVTLLNAVVFGLALKGETK